MIRLIRVYLAMLIIPEGFTLSLDPQLSESKVLELSKEEYRIS